MGLRHALRTDKLATALHARNWKTATDMVLAGADISVMGGLAIRIAVEEKNPEMVKFFLDHGADPNEGNGYVFSEAVRNNDIESVKHLIDAGANPAQHHNFEVSIAASCGMTEMLELLLDRGASPWRAHERMEAPYDLAIKNGHADTADVLKKWMVKTPDRRIKGLGPSKGFKFGL